MTSIARVTPDQYDAADPGSVASGPPDVTAETPAEAVRRVAADAAREDGRNPLNEATHLSLQHNGLEGKDLWVARDAAGAVTGFALVVRPVGTGPAEVNLVVAPNARGAGVGRALAQEVDERRRGTSRSRRGRTATIPLRPGSRPPWASNAPATSG